VTGGHSVVGRAWPPAGLPLAVVGRIVIEKPVRCLGMSYRLPRNFASQHRESNVEALNYELLQESAGTLARLGLRLERSLEALAAHDAAAGPGGGRTAERDKLVADAGESLWYYVIQREVMGLRETESVLRELGVPREVRLRMGLPRR
jgi:hypothetical protein